MTSMILINPTEREEYWDELIKLHHYQEQDIAKRQGMRYLDMRLDGLYSEMKTLRSDLERLCLEIDVLNDFKKKLEKRGIVDGKPSINVEDLKRRLQTEKLELQDTLDRHSTCANNIRARLNDYHFVNLWHDDPNIPTNIPVTRVRRALSRPATALGMYQAPSAASPRAQQPACSRERRGAPRAPNHPYSHYHTAPRARSAAELLSSTTQRFEVCLIWLQD